MKKKIRRFQMSDWLMLLVILIWGINFSLIKIALKEIPPIPFNGIRLLAGSSVLMAWLLITEKNIRVRREHIGKFVLLSISGYTIYQYIFISGINLTTASNTAVLFGISPIVMSLFSVFFKHEKIRPISWIGTLLGFTGVYIIISGKAGGIRFTSGNFAGNLLILAAILLWSHYSVSSRPLLKYYSPLKFAALTMTLGSLLFFPFTIKGILELPYSQISAKAWFLLFFSGVMALSVGSIIWFYSVRKVGNSQTAVYYNLQPVFAVIFAWLILSEVIPSSLIIGACIVLSGIVLTQKGRNCST